MAEDSAPRVKIDPRMVRKLADILDETGLSEIEVEVGEMRIRVARTTVAAAPAPVQTVHALPAPAAPQAAANPGAAAPAAAAEAAAPVGEMVKSPMVGTVYLSPQPGSDPFVAPGDRVKAGQTLLIIEAMKTMNPIPSPRDGTVLEILVNDAEPVEFGEPLVVLD